MATATASSTDLRILEQKAQRLGLGLQDIADIIGIDQSTLYRWRKNDSIPRGAMVRSRVEQFGELMQLLRRLFAGPDLAQKWIREAKPASLGGELTPMDVMRDGRIDRVLNVLHTLASGG